MPQPSPKPSNETVYAGIGSRETPEPILDYLESLAGVYAKRGWTLRSGGALGADKAFERGCDKADGAKEIYRPEDATPAAMKHAAKYHPKWIYLSPYARKLHARNSFIILGPSLNDPVDVVICWTRSGLKLGGTAQGLRIAEDYGIPILNLGDLYDA